MLVRFMSGTELRSIGLWWAGNIRVSLDFDRSLVGLAETREAVEQGYIPTGFPRGWTINLRDAEFDGEVDGQKRFSAVVKLEGHEYPRDSVAYVVKGRDNSEVSEVDVSRRQYLITAQFYKKGKAI